MPPRKVTAVVTFIILGLTYPPSLAQNSRRKKLGRIYRKTSEKFKTTTRPIFHLRRIIDSRTIWFYTNREMCYTKELRTSLLKTWTGWLKSISFLHFRLERKMLPCGVVKMSYCWKLWGTYGTITQGAWWDWGKFWSIWWDDRAFNYYCYRLIMDDASL